MYKKINIFFLFSLIYSKILQMKIFLVSDICGGLGCLECMNHIQQVRCFECCLPYFHFVITFYFRIIFTHDFIHTFLFALAMFGFPCTDGCGHLLNVGYQFNCYYIRIQCYIPYSIRLTYTVNEFLQNDYNSFYGIFYFS